MEDENEGIVKVQSIPGDGSYEKEWQHTLDSRWDGYVVWLSDSSLWWTHQDGIIRKVTPKEAEKINLMQALR